MLQIKYTEKQNQNSKHSQKLITFLKVLHQNYIITSLYFCFTDIYDNIMGFTQGGNFS